LVYNILRKLDIKNINLSTSQIHCYCTTFWCAKGLVWFTGV